MTCEHCGEDMQPRIVTGDLIGWWCLGCSEWEEPEHVRERALPSQCESCEE